MSAVDEVKAWRQQGERYKEKLLTERGELMARVTAIDEALAELGTSQKNRGGRPKRVVAVEKVAGDDAPPVVTPPTSADIPEPPEEDRVAHELWELRGWFYTLPTAYRKPVELRASGKTVGEVATTLRLDKTAVSNIVFRQRQCLQAARQSGKKPEAQAPAADSEEDPDPAAAAKPRWALSEGGVQENGNGYRWFIQRRYRRWLGPTVDTREEADQMREAAVAALAREEEPITAPRYRSRAQREAARAASRETHDPGRESQSTEALRGDVSEALLLLPQAKETRKILLPLVARASAPREADRPVQVSVQGVPQAKERRSNEGPGDGDEPQRLRPDAGRPEGPVRNLPPASGKEGAGSRPQSQDAKDPGSPVRQVQHGAGIVPGQSEAAEEGSRVPRLNLPPPTAADLELLMGGPPTLVQLRKRPGHATVSPRPLTREEKRLSGVAYYPEVGRPHRREHCEGMPRPCPFVSCSHHLYLDVDPDTGSIKFNFPLLEVWQLPETCSLDVADRGGITLEAVAALMNLTRERIRQVEVRGLEEIKTDKVGRQLGVAPERDSSALGAIMG